MFRIIIFSLLFMFACGGKSNSGDEGLFAFLFLMNEQNKQQSSQEGKLTIEGIIQDSTSNPVKKSTILFQESSTSNSQLRANSDNYGGKSALADDSGKFTLSFSIDSPSETHDVKLTKAGIKLATFQASIKLDSLASSSGSVTISDVSNTRNYKITISSVKNEMVVASKTPTFGSTGTKKKWTYMVYLGADNNLSSAGLGDVLEMETVGSNTNLNIVVQAEFSPYYSSGIDSDTRRFLVSQNSAASIPKSFQNGTSIGNVDMGKKATLTNFIKWATTSYPAENYALVIWDHGDGWKRKKLTNNNFRGAVEDATSGSYLSTKDLAQAVSDAGVKLNIINFDTCLMGMYEVAYEFKGLTDYLVFSEELEPGEGDPYDTILATITSSTYPLELATTIPAKFQAFYTSNPRGLTTKSAVDMSKMDTVHTAVMDLVSALKTNNAGVTNAITASKAFEVPEHHDLYDFAEKVIANYPSSTTIQSKATALKTAISNFVVSHKYTSSSSSSGATTHGLAVYLPTAAQTNSSDLTSYSSIKANNGITNSWHSLISNYLGGSSGSMEYSEKGAFGIYITWDTNSDLDLIINEPDGIWYMPYKGSSTPNATLSQDSADSGASEEYYIGKSQMQKGQYDFLINYYKNGSNSSATVNLYYFDPYNGYNDWTYMGKATMGLSNPENGNCSSQTTISSYINCANNYSNYAYIGNLSRKKTYGITINVPSEKSIEPFFNIKETKPGLPDLKK